MLVANLKVNGQDSDMSRRYGRESLIFSGQAVLNEGDKIKLVVASDNNFFGKVKQGHLEFVLNKDLQ